MARLAVAFDATQHDTDRQGGSYVKPPEGIYKLEVSGSELAEGDQRLQAKFKVSIIAPDDYAGSYVFHNCWLLHPNPIAQEIGNRDMARLCRAVGVQSPSDTEELHFTPFTAELRNGKPYQAKKDGYPMVDDHGAPVMRTNLEIRKFWYPDEGDIPEPRIYDVQPAANDNQPAAQRHVAANDNTQPQAQAASGGRSRPWKR